MKKNNNSAQKIKNTASKFALNINKMPAPFKKLLRGVFAALFWLAVWQLIASAVGKELLIASPKAVFARLGALCVTGGYWSAVFSSLVRVFGGYLAGILFGLVLAALSAASALLESLVTPLITAIKATPVASFIIIALVWFETPRIPTFTAALMVTPVIYGSALTAIRSVDKNLLEMAQVFAFSRVKTIRRVILPSMTPYIRSAAVTSLGLSWKAGIAAEVLCTPKGSVGRYLYESKIYLETPDLFAWTLTIIGASLLLEYIIRALLGGRGRGRK
ncbi:MAG: ABC transporter permease subunit [Eubacteriales bacterium]